MNTHFTAIKKTNAVIPSLYHRTNNTPFPNKEIIILHFGNVYNLTFSFQLTTEKKNASHLMTVMRLAMH